MCLRLVRQVESSHMGSPEGAECGGGSGSSGPVSNHKCGGCLVGLRLVFGPLGGSVGSVGRAWASGS